MTPTPSFLRIVFTAVVCWFFTGAFSAQAATTYYSGTFSATFSNSTNDFYGAFVFSFDDSAVSGEEYTYYHPDMLSLVFSPDPYRDISYDASLTNIRLVFFDESLAYIFIGGVWGKANETKSGTGDFLLRYNAATQTIDQAGGMAQGSSTTPVTLSGSYTTSTVAPVPEPVAGSLLAVGGVLVVLGRRIRGSSAGLPSAILEESRSAPL